MTKRSSGFSIRSNFPKEDKEPLTKAEAFQKAAQYCAYQERTQQEAREKLYSLGLSSEVVEELLTKLIVENYINEERFATTYAGGKFRMKKWGKLKIERALKLKQLTDYCIKKGLKEIEDEEYTKVMKELILQKQKTVQEKNRFRKNHKVAAYLISKGFEPDLVWELIKEISN